jgi:serine/threonine protein kinase
MGALHPMQQLGKYQLERRLGHGGMAELWLARPMRERQPQVVIKCVHEHLASQKEPVELFLDEARLAQKLQHPHIVEVLEVSLEGDLPLMVMKHLDGLDLERCVTAHSGPLWPGMAAALIADACAGLHYAHTLGDAEGSLDIVHRDIAPDNLMLDRRGVMKIVDFGIARASTTEVTTKTGNRKGKIRYMAPDYLEGSQHADPRADVYAMGATLFFLCTGQKPFASSLGVPAIIRAVKTQGIPNAARIRPSLPSRLVEIIAAATTRDVSRRTRTARELETSLRETTELYASPTPAELGGLVATWKAKLASPLSAPKDPGRLRPTRVHRVRTFGRPDTASGVGTPDGRAHRAAPSGARTLAIGDPRAGSGRAGDAIRVAAEAQTKAVLTTRTLDGASPHGRTVAKGRAAYTLTL